jgi:thioredoxin-related protein
LKNLLLILIIFSAFLGCKSSKKTATRTKTTISTPSKKVDTPKKPVLVSNGSKTDTIEIVDNDSISSEEPIVFKVNFDESEMLMPLFEKSKLENKPIFVFLHATWCAPCKVMEEYIFTNQDFADDWNSKFISWRIDTEEGSGPIIKDIYEVSSLPTMLFLDYNGNILVKKVGSANSSQLNIIGNEAIAAYKLLK